MHLEYKPLKKIENIKSVKSAKQCHKHMWEWIAKNNPLYHPKIDGLERLNNCYLCYWADKNKTPGQFICKSCILETKCYELHSIYDDWNSARKREDIKSCKTLAKKFANIFKLEE